MKSRKCKLCNGIVLGRKDKIFCSNDCKSSYHRQLQKATMIATTYTDKILHRNRSILLEIMGKKIKKLQVHRTVLENKNFKFDYMTGYYENAQGKRYHNVYDFSWMEFSSGEILIIRKKGNTH